MTQDGKKKVIEREKNKKWRDYVTNLLSRKTAQNKKHIKLKASGLMEEHVIKLDWSSTGPPTPPPPHEKICSNLVSSNISSKKHSSPIFPSRENLDSSVAPIVIQMGLVQNVMRQKRCTHVKFASGLCDGSGHFKFWSSLDCFLTREAIIFAWNKLNIVK